MALPTTPAMIIAATLLGAITAVFAHRRQRNPYKWFFIGFLFGMIGLLALFLFPPKRRKPVVHLASEKEEQSPSSLPVIQGPSDKFWYYLDQARQQQGPMSHHALTSAFLQGKISLSTYVWNEDMADWKELQEVTAQRQEL